MMINQPETQAQQGSNITSYLGLVYQFYDTAKSNISTLERSTQRLSVKLD
ncbi:MAG: hypothetical protein ACKPEN_16955 [Planktothrix sp.]